MLNRMSEWFKEHLVLLAILVSGFFVRIVGIFWGTPFVDPFGSIFHPDEGIIIRGAVLFPDHVFLNQNFIYPTFFSYFLGIITFPLRFFFDELGVQDHGGFHTTFYFVITVIGRFCSVLAGTGSIFLTYIFARDIYDEKRAVLASALLAFTFYHANNSSFATADVLTSFLLVLFFILLRWAFLTPESPKLFVYTGISFGLLVGTKYTAAIVGLAVAVLYGHALFMWVRDTRYRTKISLSTLHFQLVLCGASALVTFFLTTPGILLHFGSFVDSLEYLMTDLGRWDLSRTEFATWTEVFLKVCVAVGLPILLAFIFGLFFSYPKHVYELSFIAVLVVFFWHFGATIFSRYLILVAPLMAMMASNGLFTVYEKRGKVLPNFGKLIMVAVVGVSFGYCLDGMYVRLNETRTQAAHFIHNNIPPGTTLGVGISTEDRIEGQNHDDWRRPKFDFSRYQEMEVFDYPEILVVTSYDLERIVTALKSEKISRNFVYDQQHNKDWWLFTPPSPRIFRFYEGLLNPHKTQYELMVQYEKPRGIIPWGAFARFFADSPEFGPPKVNIYRAVSSGKTYAKERAELASRIGLYYPSNIQLRSYYSQNPDLYFDEENLQFQDWNLAVFEGSEADIVVPPQDPQTTRVAISQADTNIPWHIKMHQPSLPVQATHRYALRFKARADHPRSMFVAIGQRHEPWESLGLYREVEVRSGWQSYEEVFVATADDSSPQVYFDMGGSATPVELTEASLYPLPWQLEVQEGNHAELVISPDSPGKVRVGIVQAGSDLPWHIQLNHVSPVIEANRRYDLRFRARADNSRSITVGVGQAHDPWQTLGLYQAVDISEQWQEYSVKFVASHDDPNARLSFNLGGSEVPINIADVMLHQQGSVVLAGDKNLSTPIEDSLGKLQVGRFQENIEPDGPDKYFVNYRFNTLGCRGRDYSIPRLRETSRILILGDSVALGAGVHERDTIASRLEGLLNHSVSGQKSLMNHEVINCAVGGHGTKDSRKLYEVLVSKYEPDVVLLVMTPDDDQSWSENNTHKDFDFLTTPITNFLVWSDRQEGLYDRLDPDYAGSVQEIFQLQEALQRQGARLGVVVFRHTRHQAWPYLVQQLSVSLPGLTIPWLDLGKALVETHGKKAFFVHKEDKHPNQEAHRIAAQAIRDFLYQDGFLKRGTLRKGSLVFYPGLKGNAS